MSKKISLSKSIKAMFLCVALGGAVGAGYYVDLPENLTQKSKLSVEQKAQRQENNKTALMFIFGGVAGLMGYVGTKSLKDFSNRLQHLS